MTTSAAGYDIVPPDLGRNYTRGGLNEYASVSASAYSHDGCANPTGDRTKSDAMTAMVALPAALAAQLLCDDSAMILECNASNAMLCR